MQKEPERRLKEDDETHEPETNTRRKDDDKMSQSDERTISPLSLLKEDFSQFKEGVLKVFKDKDTKTELEDRPWSQAENKPASSTLGLLKEDLNQFKEDVTSVFSTSSSKDKETRSINRLSSLKEDFNHFKDDLSNVFRLGLSKERGTTKKDSSNTSKIKSSTAERTDEPFKSLFRREQKNSQKAENRVQKTFEQMDGGFMGNISEQKEETVDGEKTNNMKDEVEESESEERLPASQAGRSISLQNSTFMEKQRTCLS